MLQLTAQLARQPPATQPMCPGLPAAPALTAAAVVQSPQNEKMYSAPCALEVGLVIKRIPALKLQDGTVGP